MEHNHDGEGGDERLGLHIGSGLVDGAFVAVDVFIAFYSF
jgi:hypothetical protein